MKKELVALLLLLLILAGNLWNQRQLRSLTDGLETLVEEAAASAGRQNWPSSEAAAREAESLWLGADRYTHIFIRHTDIDALTGAFCEYRGAVAGRDPGDILASYLRLKTLISSLRGMERLSLGSVF